MMQMKRSRFSKGMQSVTQLGRWTHSQVISFGGIPFIHHYKFSQLERDWEPFSLPPPPLHFLLCFAVQRHSGICLRFWELIYFKGWHHLSPNWVSASLLWWFLFSPLKQRPGTMLFSLSDRLRVTSCPTADAHTGDGSKQDTAQLLK